MKSEICLILSYWVVANVPSSMNRKKRKGRGWEKGKDKEKGGEEEEEEENFTSLPTQ